MPDCGDRGGYPHRTIGCRISAMLLTTLGVPVNRGGELMMTHWRLLVQRGRRIEHYVAQAAGEAEAIAAVRRRRGMAHAVIVASEAAGEDELAGFNLKEGEAQRTATPKA